MTLFYKLLLIIFAPTALSACTGDQHHPISGEECAADDPVKQVDPNAANCLSSA